MEFSVPGFIKRFCTPNAILTLAEYIEDYADDETKKKGYELIERELQKLENRKTVEEKLEKMKSGKRDLYF
jgi:2-iminoacetate synthase